MKTILAVIGVIAILLCSHGYVFYRVSKTAYATGRIDGEVSILMQTFAKCQNGEALFKHPDGDYRCAQFKNL